MESRNITMSRGEVLKMGSKSVKLLIVSSSIAGPRLIVSSSIQGPRLSPAAFSPGENNST